MEILLQIIEAQGRTHKWVAKKINTHPITLSKKINGKLKLTQKDKVKLSDVLNTPIHILFP